MCRTAPALVPGICSIFAGRRRECAKVEVDVLGSPSRVVLVVYVDVKQHLKKKKKKKPPPRGSTETIWVNREVELGFHGLSWAVFCFRLFSTVGSVDTVFVTSFPATVKRASCKVHKFCFALAGSPYSM